MSGMTIKITFRKDDQQFTMLFGNSYKEWWQQAVEYIYRNHGHKTEGWRYGDLGDLDIVSIKKSRSKWKGWGGLKWCREDLFQKELNREGVQDNEPDNPKPRQYSKFVFDDYPIGYDKLKKELKRYF